MRREKRNFLDFRPSRNVKYQWKINKKDRVIVQVIHGGFFSRLAQWFFRMPKRSLIELDELGSYIWNRIDGEHTVYEISQKVKEEFGEAAEPVINRVVQFFRILKRHRFIEY